MIKFDFGKSCYSCTACSSVCPKNTISFNLELLPQLDYEKCVDCGNCENVCIQLHEKKYSANLSIDAEGYACKSINDKIRKKSSSGGVFYHLAKSIIDDGGYVCGCVYDENFMPKHILTNKLDDVEFMMGSKYVQSDLGTCLVQIKNALINDKKVLFSGVPCQLAAIDVIVNECRENLLLVGVVCHGSIDRKLWKSYLDQERKNGTITSVTMRDKSNGWLNYGLKFSFEDGSEHITYRKQNGYFLKCFTDGIFERDRCLNCNYKGDRIFADILLGDGWGIDKLFPEMVDQYGVSSVICFSEKGGRYLNVIRKFMKIKEIDVDKIVENNQRIISSPQENILRRKFLKEYENTPERIQEICKKYANPSVITRLRKK